MMTAIPPYFGVLSATWTFGTQTISTKKQEKVRLFANLFAGG
jgi:hypothetical protein